MNTIVRFAVIMCGSRGYNNYRHLADVYSWKHLLLNHGYDEKNIITLSYNDIIDETDYTLYHECNGENIYRNNFIDYEKEQCTKNNFLNIIHNPEYDKTTYKYWLFKRNEHVNNFHNTMEKIDKHFNFTKLKRKNINVLVIYINHGSVNMLSVPNAFDDDIYKDELIEALNILSKRVNSVLCIIEACYSGSFITNTDNNTYDVNDNVIIMTASTGMQSSYAYGYCNEIETFTTDEFTNNFFVFIDNMNSFKRLYLKDLYNYVSVNTNHSHMMINRFIHMNKPLYNWFTYSDKKLFKAIPVSSSVIMKNIYSVTSSQYELYNNIKRRLSPKTFSNNNFYECYKLITKTLKRLCYNNIINETNILIISRIAQFCNNYYTSDIVSSIVDNC